MSYAFRKFIAVLLALWLPLFGGNALAAGIAMQHGHQTDMAAMADCVQHHAADDRSADHQSCNGVCHLACRGYLAVKEIEPLVAPQADTPLTPYLFSFHSVFSTPLLPPPLRLI